MTADSVEKRSEISMGGRGWSHVYESFHVCRRYFVRLTKALAEKLHGVCIVLVCGSKPSNTSCSSTGELATQVLKFLNTGQRRVRVYTCGEGIPEGLPVEWIAGERRERQLWQANVHGRDISRSETRLCVGSNRGWRG